ncbi:MAG TPA: hypothetical protein VM076_05655 [Gemmatimonadaceae bacterium]|nr:hypothetical protein [Gemmatimonadaceae bacterium]
MPTLRPLALAVALGIVTLAPNANAQSRQPWSLQGSVLYTAQDLGGSAGTIGGVGVEAQLRRTLSGWSLGGGVQYSTHSSGPDDLSLTGLFVEPRFIIPVAAGSFAPYLAGRLAFLHGSLDAGAVGRSGSSNGLAFGAGAGLLYRLTERVNVDVGGAVLRQSLSNIKLDGVGEVEFPSFLGYVLKAGLSLGF